MDLGLSGRVALISGASKGIGRATALALAAEGMDVTLVARNLDELEKSRAEILAKGRRALVQAGDLKDAAVAQAAIDATIKEFGRLDLLVNNAGATKGGSLLTLSDDEWRDGFELKFFTAMRLARLAWPHLKASKGGIVNIAGVQGRMGASDFIAVGAVNAAFMLATKSMADMGVADGVRVNAVNPGTIETGRLKARIDRYVAANKVTPEEAYEALRNEERVARFGKPEEVGALIATIAGRPLEFLHGAVIEFDGGKTRAL
jgi:NAD(P)-dependent dehydrogenase (short-subunit alcohol dehydrogenase family)